LLIACANHNITEYSFHFNARDFIDFDLSAANDFNQKIKRLIRPLEA